MSDVVKETSYWADTTSFPILAAPDRLPEQIDVAIVGGGYTGLAAARELALSGARVAVFEAHGFGWGASSRNGGQVLTGAKLGASALLKRFGRERARALFASSLEAIDYVEALIRTENIACDFARSGHVELAYKPAHFAHYAHEAEVLLRDFAHPVSLLDSHALPAEIGSTSYFGGLRDDASAGLHPGRFVAGLTSAAQRAGALLFERTPVGEITPRRGAQPARIATARGAVHADQVLLATNGYTGALSPWLQRRIVPVGSYVIATVPLSDSLVAEISPRSRMFFDSKNYLYYWRTTADKRLIFGGRAEFVAPTAASTRRSLDDLRAGMHYVYQQLKDTRIEYVWGGTLGFSFDLLPHAGVTANGLHYAMGCGGHGVALLTHLGACCAHRMLGLGSNNPTFDLAFPSAPLGLYSGNPWFMPLVGAYYKLLDAIQ